MNRYDWPQYIECLTPKSNWQNILDINVEFERRKDTTEIADISLVIGKDYKNFAFYETLSSNRK